MATILSCHLRYRDQDAGCKSLLETKKDTIFKTIYSLQANAIPMNDKGKFAVSS